MATVIGIVVVLIGIMLSIALHEVGHMVPAKRFGVRVSQFMVGFGPTVWSRVRGETEYGLKWIPLGGYVRLVGMYPAAPEGTSPKRGLFGTIIDDARRASTEEIHPGEEGRAFYNLSAPKKIVVMLGGPVMNLLIALTLMILLVCVIGVSQPSTTVSRVSPCVVNLIEPAECAPGDPVSPAVAAGLKPDDVILEINGRKAGSWEVVSEEIQKAAGKTISVVVARGDEQLTFTMTPATVDRPVVDSDGYIATDDAGNPVSEPGGYAGIVPAWQRERQSLGSAIGTTAQQVAGTASLIVSLPQQVFTVAADTISGEPRDARSVMSIVGVGRVAVDVAESDSPIVDRVTSMMFLLASLNVALFVFNLIPLLPLDGGHVVNALYEGAKRTVARVRGRPRPGPADLARMMPVGYVTFFVLVVVGLVLMVADVINPVQF